MKCKFCNMDNLQWPENYVKGCRPLEPDTNIEHTWDRCKDLQNVHKNPTPKLRRMQPKNHLLDDFYIYNFADFRNV